MFDRAHRDLAAAKVPINREGFMRKVMSQPGGRLLDGPSFRNAADAYVAAARAAARPRATEERLTLLARDAKLWTFIQSGAWISAGMAALTSIGLGELPNLLPGLAMQDLRTEIAVSAVTAFFAMAMGVVTTFAGQAQRGVAVSRAKAALTLDAEGQRALEEGLQAETRGASRMALETVAPALWLAPVIATVNAMVLAFGKPGDRWKHSKAISAAVDATPHFWPSIQRS